MAYDYRGARDRIFGIIRDGEKVKVIVKTSATITERALMLALVEYAPNISPSVTALAAMLGTDERSVRRLLASCAKKGHLLVDRRPGFRSAYTLLTNPALKVRTDSESGLTQSPDSPDSEPGPPRALSPVKRTREADNKADAQVSDWDHENLCPADLEQRAESAGVFAELARALGADAERLRAECRSFVSYWTIGGGAGKRRNHWMAKLRQRLVDNVQTGTLPKLATTASDETGGYGAAADWS